MFLMAVIQIILIILIFTFFIASAVFSFQSFTGYLISDVANNEANLTAFFLFLAGVLGMGLYLARFRDK